MCIRSVNISPLKSIIHDAPRDAGLDGLRAVAVALVLGFHFFPEVVPYGYLGVDMFFVLSGYFIASQIGFPGANIPQYLGRRFLRIYPAVITVILATLVAGWFAQLPLAYMLLGQNSLIGLTGMTNIFPPLSDGYFAARADTQPLLHLWSLGVELQIYLASALTLPLLTRFVSLRALMGAIIAISLIWLYFGLHLNGDSGFFNTGARAWQFALGGLIATLPRTAVRKAPLALLMVLSSIVLAPDLLDDGARTVLLSIITALLIATLRGRTQSILGWMPLVGLGRISFSLYLWHWPILVLWTGYDLNGVSMTNKVGLIALSACLSILTWLWVEKTFLSKSNTQWRMGALAGLTFITLSLSGAVIFSHGAAQRLPADAQAILKEVRPAHDLINTCHSFTAKHLSPEYACRHNEKQAQIQTAVLGDSHGMVLAGGLARTGFPFVEYTFSGCAPTPKLYPQTHGPYCATWVEQALTRIEADPDIKTVILAARWAFYSEPRFENGRGGRDVHPGVVMKDALTHKVASRLRINTALASTITRLGTAGKRVVIYYPGPTFGWSIEDTLARSAWWNVDVDTSVPRALIDARQRQVRRMLDRAKGADIARYDPLLRFCNGSTCSPIGADGTIFLQDQDHLSRGGADMVAKDLLIALNDMLKEGLLQ